ncbi:Pectinesterase inhibitor 11 [Bienertia sinuspersici]
MTTLNLFFFIFTLLFAASAFATTTTSTNSFIQSKCSSTTYPSLCVQSLSTFANKIHESPRQLAQTALIMSLSKARYAKTCIAHLVSSGQLRPRDLGPLKDCLEVIGDSVDRLSMAVHEFQAATRAHSTDFLWHMSNVQTWASAALTDENTCVDGFEGPNRDRSIQNEVKAQFEGVMQCTSNALCLVNEFVNQYTPRNS